ncbi:hypothetical protein GC177_03890 [bacterium]|nr:hypothetical protein [bacterium]
MKKPSKATILPPDTSLKQKIGNRPLETLVDADRVESAQQAVFNNLDQFLNQTQTDIKSIELLLEEIEQGYSGDLNLITSMENAFFRIMSTAGTFGYMLASRVANQGHDYVVKHHQMHAAELKVIRAYALALKSIFTHNIRGDGGKMGKELLTNLTMLTDKFSRS